MAGSYNKVLLMGNLTRDIELKYTQNNNAVANIGLAVNRRFKSGDGQMREETTFVDCEAWGRTAEVMSQYLTKGRPVFIEGRLKLDQWQDQQGNNKSKLRVVIDSFQFIDSSGGGGGGGGGGQAPRSQQGGQQGSQAPQQAPSQTGSPVMGGGGGPVESFGEDDIPF